MTHSTFMSKSNKPTIRHERERESTAPQKTKSTGAVREGSCVYLQQQSPRKPPSYIGWTHSVRPRLVQTSNNTNNTRIYGAKTIAFLGLTKIASATIPGRTRAYSALVRVRNLSARPSSSSITMRRNTGWPVTGWYCHARKKPAPPAIPSCSRSGIQGGGRIRERLANKAT